MKMIKLQNLVIGYDNIQLLSAIDYQFNENEMVAIVGSSGIGKTTFFKTICGFIAPVSGNVKINNLDVHLKNNKKQIARLIGFLTQENTLIEFENVFNNIIREVKIKESFWNKIFGITSKTNQKKIIETLDLLGIKDKTLTRVDHLSGGQKQRVNIAKILLNNNKIILADEPTSNLDQKTAVSIIDLLYNLKKSKTIFVIIHNISLLSNKFDKIMYFNNKKIEIYNEVNNKLIEEIKRKNEE